MWETCCLFVYWHTVFLGLYDYHTLATAPWAATVCGFHGDRLIIKGCRTPSSPLYGPDVHQRGWLRWEGHTGRVCASVCVCRNVLACLTLCVFMSVCGCLCVLLHFFRVRVCLFFCMCGSSCTGDAKKSADEQGKSCWLRCRAELHGWRTKRSVIRTHTHTHLRTHTHTHIGGRILVDTHKHTRYFRDTAGPADSRTQMHQHEGITQSGKHREYSETSKTQRIDRPPSDGMLSRKVQLKCPLIRSLGQSVLEQNIGLHPRSTYFNTMYDWFSRISGIHTSELHSVDMSRNEYWN